MKDTSHGAKEFMVQGIDTRSTGENGMFYKLTSYIYFYPL